MQKSAPADSSGWASKMVGRASATLKCTAHRAAYTYRATCDLHIDANFCRIRLCDPPWCSPLVPSTGPRAHLQNAMPLYSQRFAAGLQTLVRAAASSGKGMVIDGAKNQVPGGKGLPSAGLALCRAGDVRVPTLPAATHGRRTTSDPLGTRRGNSTARASSAAHPRPIYPLLVLTGFLASFPSQI